MDIIDGNWKLVKKPGAFSDPWLPKGYCAVRHPGPRRVHLRHVREADPRGATTRQHGKGLGIVDEYSTDGVLLHRVATRGKLNAPWGLAWAPATGFGKASGALLVGNFGDGHINTFRQDHKGRWKWSGRLLTKKKQAGLDRRPLGHRLRQRRDRRADDDALLRGRAGRRERTASSARSPRIRPDR